MSETKAKKILRHAIGGWSESYEPGRGSGVGYPDLQFLADGILIPVEVKIGRESGCRIFSERIRPSQIQWHHEFQEAGGDSFVFVCFGSGAEFRAWAIPKPTRDITSQWRNGWEVSKCTLVVQGRERMIGLSSLVAERRNAKN